MHGPHRRAPAPSSLIPARICAGEKDGWLRQCSAMTPDADRPAGSVAVVASVEVIGVYTVPEAPEPCHLIEIVVRDSSGFDAPKFVQPDPTQSEENWQVAYDERA